MGEYRGKFCQAPSVYGKDAIYHLLRNLKQRFESRQTGKFLVYDVKREFKVRYTPHRNIKGHDIEKRIRSYTKIANDTVADIYKFAPQMHNILRFDSYSKFQLWGWRLVYETLNRNDGLIITAPTGSGKTEVFIPPLIYKIIEDVNKSENYMALIIYPRISLLKDQASRIFKYIHNARQAFNPREDITVGLQFGGIATSMNNTLNNRSLFDNNSIFKLFNCPICKEGSLKFHRKGRRGHFLECINCSASWHVSLAKDEHVKQEVNILITTFESLDRLFLHPKFEDLFNRLNAIFIDEVHLFHGIYGAHISNFIENIELVKEQEVAKIGISATIAEPKDFGSKLLYKSINPQEKLFVLDARDKEFNLEESGCELIYFIKAREKEEEKSLDTACFIQTVMVVGHGILKSDEQALAFIDSIDLVKRLKSQIKDAEETKGLWKFRTITEEITFGEVNCPRTNLCECEINNSGECWRIINSKPTCYADDVGKLKANRLSIAAVSSQSVSIDWLYADIILSTPSLEVGIDINTITATLHYRAPRTIFSFIQKRGRAGRKSKIAYTFVVLGNTSMDNFYFYKKHRLLDESRYTLPLNPYNAVIKRMHNKLIEHRDKISRMYKEKDEKAQKVICAYIIEFLENCFLIKDIYGEEIRNLKESDNFKTNLKNWITTEKERLEEFLNTEYILRDIEEMAPNDETLIQKMNRLREIIRKGNYIEIENVKKDILKILLQKAQEILDNEGLDNYNQFRKNMNELEISLNKIKTHEIPAFIAEKIDNYYFFFKTLYDKLEANNANWTWKSNSVPDIVKSLFQASFYLHLDVLEKEDNSCVFKGIDFYLPDAFFQEVKPIVIEFRRGADKHEVVLEDSSLLDFMLIPYKPIYRYSDGEFLNIIDTGPNSIDTVHCVDSKTFKVILPIKTEYIKGIDKGDSYEVSALSVKFLKTDTEGKQTLKLCPKCFTLYSYNRKTLCHNTQLKNVRLKAEPVSEKDSKIREVEGESKQFKIAKLEVQSRILGSDVKVYQTKVSPQGEIFPTTNLLYELKVRYEKPLSYKLLSKGIIWKISDSVLENLASEEKEKLLHTGAHILLKTVASLGGVHEQVLQYRYKKETGEIYVWERYEGGIGIVDTVFRKIKESTIDFYKELVSIVLCPIYLSDKVRKGDIGLNTLKENIMQEWFLGEDDELVKEIYDEVNHELSLGRGKEGDLGCEDGCPVCVYINYCQSGFEQEKDISRNLGEILLKSLLIKESINNLGEDNIKNVLVRNKDSAIFVDL